MSSYIPPAVNEAFSTYSSAAIEAIANFRTVGIETVAANLPTVITDQYSAASNFFASIEFPVLPFNEQIDPVVNFAISTGLPVALAALAASKAAEGLKQRNVVSFLNKEVQATVFAAASLYATQGDKDVIFWALSAAAAAGLGKLLFSSSAPARKPVQPA